MLGKSMRRADKLLAFRWSTLNKELDLFMVFDIITYCCSNGRNREEIRETRLNYLG